MRIAPNHMTRRRLLRAGSGLGLGAAGAAVLAACGETKIVTKEVPVETTIIKEVPVETIVTKTQIKEVPVEKIVQQTQIKEVPVERVVMQQVEVEKVVTKVVEVEKVVEKVVEKIVEVEAAPQPMAQIFAFGTDHTSGPRGAAMQWALDRFAQVSPHLNVKFVAAPTGTDQVYGVQFASGSQPEVALMTGWFAAGWYAAGAFVQIDDLLRKRDDFDPNDFYWYPDTATPNFQHTRHDPRTGMRGPSFGMNFQGNIQALALNLSMAEALGIPEPKAGSFGALAEFEDALFKATDPETDTFGIRPTGYWFSLFASIGFSHASDPELMWYSQDATRTTFVDSGADLGLRKLADWLLVDKVIQPSEMNKELSGEFGDPFSSGKNLFRQGGGPFGSQVGRIKDRFKWALSPLPEGPDGQPVLQQFSDQPHLITATADTRGNVEGAVEWAAFLSGTEVQTRIAVDRGSVVVRKDAADSDEMAAGPPENHAQFREWLNVESACHPQFMFPSYIEWHVNSHSSAIANKIWLGELTVDEAIPLMYEAGDAILAENAERYAELQTYVNNAPNPI